MDKSLWRASSKTFQQIGDSDLKSIGNDFQRLNRDVALSALEFANVSPIKSRVIREDVLRPATPQAQPPHRTPDLLLNILHLQQFRATLGLSIQVITCNEIATLGGLSYPSRIFYGCRTGSRH